MFNFIKKLFEKSSRDCEKIILKYQCENAALQAENKKMKEQLSELVREVRKKRLNKKGAKPQANYIQKESK